MSWHFSQRLLDEYMLDLPSGIYAEAQRAAHLLDSLPAEKQRGWPTWAKDRAAIQALQDAGHEGRIPADVCGKAPICEWAQGDSLACDGDGACDRASHWAERVRTSQERQQDGQPARELGVDAALGAFQASCNGGIANEGQDLTRAICVSLRYLRALVAAFSAGTCLAGDASAPWNSMPFAPDDSCSDKMKDTCHRSPFGTMYAPSTDTHGAALLTWFLAGFHAKTSARPEPVTDSTASAAACGVNTSGFLAKFDPSTHTWKTAQLSLLADLESSLEIWPRWGSMRNGECWERTAPAWTIAATECGLLPTPLATDCKGGATAPRPDNGKLRMDQWRDYVKMKYALTYPHPTHSEIRLGWPAGWSDFAPLETDKFLAWQRLHGEPLTNFKDQAA